MKSLPSDHQYRPFLEFLQNNGVSDVDFLTGILCQVNGISVYSRNATERDFLLSIIKGGNPKTQTDVLLLTQMAAIHDAVMTSARNLGTTNDPELVERFANVTNKLARTFTAQVEALQRCSFEILFHCAHDAGSPLGQSGPWRSGHPPTIPSKPYCRNVTNPLLDCLPINYPQMPDELGTKASRTQLQQPVVLIFRPYPQVARDLSSVGACRFLSASS